MANSSEWLGALGALAEAPDAAPGWLALLGEEADFREALPFGASAPLAAPAPMPEPEPAAAAEDARALA